MPKLSERFIGEIRKPDRGQIIYRDSDLKGFGLRVTPGCISYIVECRVNGASRRLTIARHDELTPDQARRAARRLLLEMSESKRSRSKPSNVTLREVLDSFFETRKLKPNTVRNYRNLLCRCLPDWLDLPIVSITGEMVQAKHKELTRATRQGTAGEYQANGAMRTLSCLISFAADNYENDNGQPILLVNPVKKLSKNKAWHKEHRRRVIIPDHKLKDWYRAVMSVRQHKVRDFLVFVVLTGLRKNEATTLRWEDVDFETKTITIRHEIAKNDEDHCLPLSDFLVLLLNQRKLHTGCSEYVFPGQSGNGHMVDCGDVVDRVIRESDCEFVLHDLRRTYVSMAAKLGIPHHVIKKLVNHIGGTDTTDGYIVIHNEHLRKPMAQITDQFLGLFGTDLNDWQVHTSDLHRAAHICPCVKMMPPH